MKLKSIFDKLDWLAELPRLEYGVWRPAKSMGSVEYGIKLLVGLVIVAVTMLAVLSTVCLTVAAVAALAIYCPVTIAVVVGVLALAIGIGWLRKNVGKELGGG